MPAQEDDLPALPEPGQVVGARFEILDELGDGGMGHVYRVRDHQLGRNVALKLIVPRYVGRADREQRFFLEAQLGQRVGRHPHIVEIIESGRLSDRGDWPFIAMELVEGRSLPTYLVLHGPMKARRAVTIARQVASAILAMHTSDVVHRDISSANVVLHDEGVTVIDFSHAGDLRAPRVAAGEAGRLTQPHEVIGTHTCMAPEQARAEPPSTAMDVYSFGILLYELLTGHNPYEDAARDTFLSELVSGEVQPPRITDASVPEPLAEIVSACTVPEPSRRPNIHEVVRRLDHVISSMNAVVAPPLPQTPPPVATIADRMPTAVVSPASVVSPPGTNPAGPATTRGNPWRWIAIAAILVAVVAVGFAISTSRRTEDDPAVPVEREGDESPSVGIDDEALASRRDLGQAPGDEPADTGTAAAEASTDGGSSTADLPGAEPHPKSAPAQPEPPKPERDAPKPRPSPKPSIDCDEQRRVAAKADLTKNWTKVLRATRHVECWERQADRVELRVRALLNLGRYDECAALPKGSATTETRRMIAFCEAAGKKGEGG